MTNTAPDRQSTAQRGRSIGSVRGRRRQGSHEPGYSHSQSRDVVQVNGLTGRAIRGDHRAAWSGTRDVLVHALPQPDELLRVRVGLIPDEIHEAFGIGNDAFKARPAMADQPSPEAHEAVIASTCQDNSSRPEPPGVSAIARAIPALAKRRDLGGRQLSEAFPQPTGQLPNVRATVQAAALDERPELRLVHSTTLRRSNPDPIAWIDRGARQ
jgi:hypothetical protein